MEEGVKELVVDELCEVGNRWSPQSKVSGQRLLEGLSTEIERSAKASKSIKKKVIFGSPVSANDTFPPLSPLVNKGKLEGLSNKVNRIKDELTKDLVMLSPLINRSRAKNDCEVLDRISEEFSEMESMARVDKKEIRGEDLVFNFDFEALKAESRKKKQRMSTESTVVEGSYADTGTTGETVLEREIEMEMRGMQDYFEEQESFGIEEKEFVNVTKILGMPRYCNKIMYKKMRELGWGSDNNKEVHNGFLEFSRYWRKLRVRHEDDREKILFDIISRGKGYAKRADLRDIVYDVIENHTELKFLEGHAVFEEKFCETIIERIFYEANSYIGDKMGYRQYKKVNMLKILKGIEDLGIDVNVEHPSVFSYKHFYVIFCSFYELDEDKDGYICGKNLKRYFDGALPKRVISRILNGKGKPKASLVVEGDGGEKRHKKKAMDYGDFVWFLVAEIDKGSETAVGYWFRILDLDEDGILSLYELEYFYEEICQKMEIDNNGEKITLADITCQLIDMVRPKEIGKVTVSDIKKLKYDLRPIFFDAFINLYRFYEHENRASALHKQLAKFMALKLAAYNTNGGDSSSDNENGTDHDHGKTNQKNSDFSQKNIKKSKLTVKEIVELRIKFLENRRNPWTEFADLEYEGLISEEAE